MLNRCKYVTNDRPGSSFLVRNYWRGLHRRCTQHWWNPGKRPGLYYPTIICFTSELLLTSSQTWWNFFSLPENPREDGDGRPVSLTLSHVKRGAIKNFQVQAPPFWCNAVADSQDVLYQGMVCNATNTNPGESPSITGIVRHNC